MAAPMNGMINASRLTLRHWRDIPNTRRLLRAACCQNKLSFYRRCINSTVAQKRWISAAKALVEQDKQLLPKSDIPATAADRPLRRPALLLRTLDQTQLDVEDFIDISGRLSRNVRFPVAPEQPRLQMRYFQPNVPIPSGSQGFLYWHLDPDAPPVSGQVRFRVTTSSDPATFPNGRDLQLPDGRTWNISLFEIARRSTYSGLRAHLISEKLVTAKVVYTALSISAPHGARTFHPGTGSLLIWKFGQSFLVDLQSFSPVLWIIGSSAAERLRLARLFSFMRNDSGSTGIIRSVERTPFAGRALVQFEHSTLPEHKGTRTVVLRFVKIIELTKTKGFDVIEMPEPKDGGLLMHRKNRRHWTPWLVDVDRPQQRGKPHSLSKALTILFDNEAHQSQ
ncbi:hypothetical protein OE88DRAFT_1739662 [Heliocybe sulcata]|uniref:Uncharacterized protein n=1 Tax=Heliocybe sulcata TaxID=5364 RepID=A0A5C3MMV1_9AGAM|nr:hypothetical protein OE88DRAFT_1739662 [Heliocybe sulcata]